MKERPIIFSTPMVQAILEGRKSQTRRVVKPQPTRLIGTPPNKWPQDYPELCPYGQLSDRLWVRETWANVLFHKMFYKADDDRNLPKGCKWKPSIHMFKMYARIWLEITNIRVERLQDISEGDAKAEGVEIGSSAMGHTFTHIEHYRALWNSINKKKHPWADNPWVWVINFQIAPQGSILNPSATVNRAIYGK